MKYLCLFYQLLILILLVKIGYAITCTNTNASAYTTIEQKYKYSGHSSSGLNGILTGPTSGDLYIIGKTTNVGDFVTLRRMNIEYVEQWSRMYQFNLSNSAFEIDSSETHLYIFGQSAAQLYVYNIKTSDGALDITPYDEPFLRTTNLNTIISIIATNDILYFSADEGFGSTYHCQWNVSTPAFTWANYSYLYPAFAGSGIDTNQAYFGSLRNDNGDLYLSKLDFSTSNIEVWTSGITRVSGATSNNPEY